MRALAALAVVALLAVSPGAAAASDVRFHGLLDLVATGRGDAQSSNVLARGDSPFDPYGTRLFADAQVDPHLAVHGQVVVRDATSPYVEGAWLEYTPSAARDLHVLAGKIPWAIGAWAPRAYSDQNPLIGAPLMYQHHSTLVWYALPSGPDGLLAAAGSGDSGVNYFGSPMGRGMPIVDDSYWDVGVTLTGSERPLEDAVGVTAGVPGWGNTSQDENNGRTLLGRVGLAPWPWLRAGVSGAWGPYLDEGLDPRLPAGQTASDYHQELTMADLELSAGHFELHAEGARNFWETPTVGRLAVNSGYVELKVTSPFGGWAAGRLDAIRYGTIEDSSGESRPWDDDIDRLEAGVGWRFTRAALGKLVYQRSSFTGYEGPDRVHSLMAAQVSVAF